MKLPERTHHYQNAVMNSARWDSYTPREGDIIITTSYKAGTTWMQGICAALVFQRPEPPVPQDELTPWYDANFAPVGEVNELLDNLTNRRYLKTHCPIDGVRYFSEVKYIFVGRDGRDVFASMWNHWNNMNESAIDDLNNAPDREGPTLPYPPGDPGAAFDEWLTRGSFDWEQDGYPFWSHLHHAQSWWDYRHLDNILFVHFSDLIKDTDGQMRRISAYLDIPINEAIWPQLLEGVSFARMKANAEKMAPGVTGGMWKNPAQFFDKGENQRWRGLISPEQSARYEEVTRKRLTPDLYDWLAHGTLKEGATP
jgi:aryl sulfotransferase